MPLVKKYPKVINITGQLIINLKSREWCTLPYPGHPKGCPNYNKNPECPPQAPIVSEHFNLNKSHWFVVVKFNLKAQANRMKSLHPQWSDKQARCCLYWQNTVRKQLRETCNDLLSQHPGTSYTLIPEAMGVNVMSTARKLNIPIATKPNDIIFKIALVGYPTSI